MKIANDSTTTWHAGNRFYNEHSIGIEMCINYDSNREKMKENTVKTVVRYMKAYNIPINRVIRHYDVTGKLCPASFSANNWQEWKELKQAIEEEYNK